ncbi:MAG: 3-keto-disaccharide hydrolase [Candidatus Rokuibacteriota bacterium]
MFRFDIGDHVRVVTHPARPAATVVGRWPGERFADAYDDNVYAVTGFVTRQRESNLAAEGFTPLPLEPLADWRMAGAGEFRRAGPGIVESDGGPGILWYAREEFDDFLLFVDWRLAGPDDNSGVFVRIPPLAAGDWTPAVEHGYEIQIDPHGLDPASGEPGSPRHRTGAVYGLAPADPVPVHAGLRWNAFAIVARGDTLSVALNGRPVSALTGDRRRRGHIGLQAHHPGSRVQYRNLQIKRLARQAAAGGTRLAA